MMESTTEVDVAQTYNVNESQNGKVTFKVKTETVGCHSVVNLIRNC